MDQAVQPQRFGRSPRLSAQVIGHLLADVLNNWPAGSLLPRETDLAEASASAAASSARCCAGSRSAASSPSGTATERS